MRNPTDPPEPSDLGPVSASAAGIRGVRPFPLSRPEADLLALVLAAGHQSERLRLVPKQNRILEALTARLWEFRENQKGNQELFALPQAPRDPWGRFCAEADLQEARARADTVEAPWEPDEPHPNLDLGL